MLFKFLKLRLVDFAIIEADHLLQVLDNRWIIAETKISALAAVSLVGLARSPDYIGIILYLSFNHQLTQSNCTCNYEAMAIPPTEPSE